MIPFLPLCAGLCVVAGFSRLSAGDAVPPCTVSDVMVAERRDVEGQLWIQGSFRIEAPAGFWLPEPSFLVWKHDNSRCFWSERFAPRWVAKDSEGRMVPREGTTERDVSASFSCLKEVADDEPLAPDEEQEKKRRVMGSEIPELVVVGTVRAEPRLWTDGKLSGEVRLMVAPREFTKCETLPVWVPSFMAEEEKVLNPVCEMRVWSDTKEMRIFVDSWLKTSWGHWSGLDGGGVVQSVCFIPDYKAQKGDVFYKVSFTARDKVFRNVSLVPKDGDASAVRLIGFSMMELGGSTKGQWEESYLFVMPKEDDGVRVRWEEQRVREVRVPVLLDVVAEPQRK